MADQDARLMERSIDPSLTDKTKILLARLRAGEISHLQIEWAARLGHETALEIVGKLHPERVTNWILWWDRAHAIRSVGELLCDYWRRPVVAFAADCAGRVLPIYEKNSTNKTLREAIEAVRAWIREPDAAHAADAAVYSDAAYAVAATNSASASASISVARVAHAVGLGRDADRTCDDVAAALACAADAIGVDAGDQVGEAWTVHTVRAYARARWEADDTSLTANFASASCAEYAWQKAHLASYVLGEIEWESRD